MLIIYTEIYRDILDHSTHTRYPLYFGLPWGDLNLSVDNERKRVL